MISILEYAKLSAFMYKPTIANASRLSLGEVTIPGYKTKEKRGLKNSWQMHYKFDHRISRGPWIARCATILSCLNVVTFNADCLPARTQPRHSTVRRP